MSFLLLIACTSCPQNSREAGDALTVLCSLHTLPSASAAWVNVWTQKSESCGNQSHLTCRTQQQIEAYGWRVQQQEDTGWRPVGQRIATYKLCPDSIAAAILKAGETLSSPLNGPVVMSKLQNVVVRVYS